MIVIGFEEPDYTVNEDDGTVEVCLNILEPNTTDIFISGILVTNDGTALGMSSSVCAYSRRSTVCKSK